MANHQLKNMWRLWVQCVLSLLLVAPMLSQAYTGVTIVLSAQTQTNLEFVDQFKNELALASNQRLKVSVVDLSDVEQLSLAENSELVVALGVKALTAASKLKHTTPVIGVFTPLPTFNTLLASSHRDLGNFTAIVLDQPYSRQLSLIKAVLPEAKALGVLLGSTSSIYADNIKEESEKMAFNSNIEFINSEDDLIPKLKKALDANDTLLAVPDPLIYNRETAQSILLTSYRYHKPVFGYSQSYVRAGALAAVYSTTKQLAKQVAEVAVSAQQAAAMLPPPQVPKYFTVQFNQQVARSLNIPILTEEETLKRVLQLETQSAAELAR